MRARSPAPSPRAFRSRGRSLTTLVWVFGLLVAAAGVGLAVVDASRGASTSGAADAAFGPPSAPPTPDLPRPPPASAAPPAATPGNPPEDPAEVAAARAARAREADHLIEQLKTRLRADREARTKAGRSDPRGR